MVYMNLEGKWSLTTPLMGLGYARSYCENFRQSSQLFSNKKIAVPAYNLVPLKPRRLTLCIFNSKKCLIIVKFWINKNNRSVFDLFNYVPSWDISFWFLPRKSVFVEDFSDNLTNNKFNKKLWQLLQLHTWILSSQIT